MRIDVQLRYRNKNRNKLKEYAKNYYKNNKKKVLSKAHTYYESNKEKIALRHKKYYLSNKEKINKRGNDYSMDRYYSDTAYRLAHILRSSLRQALKSKLAGKKVSAIKDLGCSIDFFIKHIESLWLPGMTWYNYGKGSNKWNIDHRIALLRKDHSILSEETQKKLVHYSNLQPLWELDNLKKGNR